MTKTRNPKKSRLIFSICLMVYAILFLIVTAVALNDLWGYMESYEVSRPKHAVNSYMEQLAPEYVCNRSTQLFAQVDGSIQTEADCRQVITESLRDKFSCVKNLGESDESKTVYLIRCGTQIIGRFTIAPGEADENGFSVWSVVAESFDLSYLLTAGHTVTVPENYTVYGNGTELNESHIIESSIRFPLLEDLYDEYDLPTLVTYQTGTTLGPVAIEVADPNGVPVLIDSSAELDTMLPACSPDIIQRLDTVTSDFLQDYVDFTSCTNNDTNGNYQRLLAHMVPGSKVAKRMQDAIAGLYWVTDRNAKLVDIEIRHYVDIGGGKFLCDVVYKVDTRNISGSVQTESHVKIIFTESSGTLKAEAMLTY